MNATRKPEGIIFFNNIYLSTNTKGNNMKNLLFSILVLFVISNANVFGANEHTFSICNINRTSAKVVRFDVWMKNTSSNPTDTIFIQSPTFNINYNQTGIKNGGTITAAYNTTNLPVKMLPTQCRPNNPDVSTAGVVRGNGASKSQDFTSDPSGFQMYHYTLVPGDSVMCVRFQLTTSASTFAVAPLNLSFRGFGTSSPVTSCTYFKRWDEGATGYFCADDGSNAPDPGNPIQPVSYTLSTSSNESYFNIDAQGNTPLPVELTTFASAIKGRDVSLIWHTATEVNFAKFVVERAVSGTSTYAAVGTVQAAGNSNSGKDYIFPDKKLNSGTYTYRLKMVDLDGSYQYSKNTVEAIVALPKQYEISQNYPNPFNPSSKIDYQLAQDSHVTLELYNISGQKVAEVLNDQQAAGYYTVDVSPSVTAGLASGVYLYRIAAIGKTADSKFVSIKKMILMK